MLNLFQHLYKETPKQVRGDRLLCHPELVSGSISKE